MSQPKHTPAESVPKFGNQEIISDDHVLFVTRLEVPGGWIYNSYDKSVQIMGSVFVPYPPKLIAASPDMLDALKKAHRALDHMMARMVSLVPEYLPTQDKFVWEAVQDCHAAMTKATSGDL